MKPSNNQGATKKTVTKINNYFKSAPKTFAIVENNNVNNNNTIDDSRAFYIGELKKKLQTLQGVVDQRETNESESEAVGAYSVEPVNAAKVNVISVTSSNHTHDINDLKSKDKCAGCEQKAEEIKNWEMKYGELKKRYLKLTIHNSELELKPSDLLKTVTHANHSNFNDAVASSDDIFTPNEIRALRGLSLEKNKDSSFILQCLKYAYKGNLSALRHKSLNGVAESVLVHEEGVMERVAGKDPLTPKKVERIKELFIERISAANIDSVEYGERIKNSRINTLFSSGIKNIAKRQNQQIKVL